MLIPESYNDLLNPLHSKFEKVAKFDGPYPLGVNGRIADLLKRADGSGEIRNGRCRPPGRREAPNQGALFAITVPQWTQAAGPHPFGPSRRPRGTRRGC